jgi:hypothetical protein
MRRLLLLITAFALGFTACLSSPATTGKDKSKTEHAPLELCHPGCFPAGTLITTPDGTRAIETIRTGDLITLVDSDGTPRSGRVNSCFQTCNRLVEVRTDFGNLLTTQTQPLYLREGGFRPAGELAEGDLIWQWEKDKRRAAHVLSVVQTEHETQVFNLVVGDSAIFIAGEFLARGKPPPADNESTNGRE